MSSGLLQGRRETERSRAHGAEEVKEHSPGPKALEFPREPGNRRLKGLGEPRAESGRAITRSALDPGNTELWRDPNLGLG